MEIALAICDGVLQISMAMPISASSVEEALPLLRVNARLTGR